MNAITTDLFCCGCDKIVSARLAGGREIYPRRDDLAGICFWKCDACGNHVGCHHRSKTNPTKPLGPIPTPEIRKARQHVHRILDPIWKSGRMQRGEAYARMAKALGKEEYHTGDIIDLDFARRAYSAAMVIASEAKARPSAQFKERG